jgi:hypothetical protein
MFKKGDYVFIPGSSKTKYKVIALSDDGEYVDLQEVTKKKILHGIYTGDIMLSYDVKEKLLPLTTAIGPYIKYVKKVLTENDIPFKLTRDADREDTFYVPESFVEKAMGLIKR